LAPAAGPPALLASAAGPPALLASAAEPPAPLAPSAGPPAPLTPAVGPLAPLARAAWQAVLWLNPALEMSAGKAMAQAGHAAQLAWWGSDPLAREAWAASGLAVAVRTAEPGQWAELVESGLPVVRDAGFTEVEPGSCTVVADAPWLREGGYRIEGYGPMRSAR
ncbi:peptidyl-tRNA hydrolase, partial [Microtetraspora sp. NBRC 13810]|uniref:peptidyl-tRNA hydrolase n=1 Tax=Microtetraspora sp. NBRC 13810 TaxID=3030990 RepID=UPI0025526B23